MTIQFLERRPVIDAIINALADVLKRDASSITESTPLFEGLGLDSTTVLELLMRLEDEAGMEFDTDTLEQRHFETVGTLASYVLEQV